MPLNPTTLNDRGRAEDGSSLPEYNNKPQPNKPPQRPAPQFRNSWKPKPCHLDPTEINPSHTRPYPQNPTEQQEFRKPHEQPSGGPGGSRSRGLPGMPADTVSIRWGPGLPQVAAFFSGLGLRGYGGWCARTLCGEGVSPPSFVLKGLGSTLRCGETVGSRFWV